MIANRGISLEAHILSGCRKVHKDREKNPDSKYRHLAGPDLIVGSYPKWESRCLLWVQEALVTLYSKASRAHGNGSSLKLTNLSTSIGSQVIRDINNEGYPCSDDIVSQVVIGDYFLSAMMCEDLIDVGRESKSHTSPYVVTLLHVVLPKITLRATTTEMPSSITNLLDPQGYSYIKRWSGKDKTEQFKRMVQENVPHIQALNRLRMQSWEVNHEVLKILKDNFESLLTRSIQLVDTDGEIHTVSVDQKLSKRKFPAAKYSWYKEGATKFLPFQGDQDPALQKIRSKNVDAQLTMNKALAASELGLFYQEYSCDWRGRMYCNESFFQYQGSDVARGLFLFGTGKPYGIGGLRALKVHIANCYATSLDIEGLPDYLGARDDYIKAAKVAQLTTVSLDKLTLSDRVRWVDANIDFIRNNRKLLAEADKPVSFLAACIELDNALVNPEFVGRLPIPLDGSNNGWQHLARISMDAQAGKLVSLTDSKLQKDFYVAVAQEVLKHHREFFAAKGMTKMKHIRKWLKRAVMVRAYSAGSLKIAENLWTDAGSEGFNDLFDIVEKECMNVSHWVIAAIKVVCSGPLGLTRLLQSVAAFETRDGARFNGMQWTTPSGFPVHYLAHQTRDKYIRGRLHNLGQINHVLKEPVYKRIKLEDGTYQDTDKFVLNGDDYASGIAPNYVHSMDAAHLALTVAKFDGAFGAVHDSFATHGNDIHRLGTVIRQQFYDMYQGYGDVTFDDKGKPTNTGYEKMINSLAAPDIWTYQQVGKKGKVTKFIDCIPAYKPDNRLKVSGVLTSRYFFC